MLNVLGIETSCDETGASVVRGAGDVVSNVVASSLAQHAPYGGIIPEIASRAQMEFICAVVREAMEKARLKAGEMDAIAVTQGPGLIGSLLVGLSFARALSLAWRVPLIGINHLQAHLYAAFIGSGISFPFTGLVVSGGHTSLYEVTGIGREKLVGSTRDDAAGEAFDKVAKILGLGYPGGPAIEAAARKGSSEAFRFRCDCGPGFDFSFSGIKTAVLYKARDLKKLYGRLSPATVADLTASFQSAVVEDLVGKACRLAQKSHSRLLAVGGGVAFNTALRSRLQEETRQRNIELRLAPKAYCLDNAAMVASLGVRLLEAGKSSKRACLDTLMG
ncbi:tRNA (adenosine(37)-N6)-threonylcarbamoyltransferase complex transferase subunit TsaD [Candidatus Velamenicoccus archaeovorus]|uniref:tRNA (adenosine(37)-N6)-threonylcarbamoyltransferase complex transferase subunit TsaD n=1 Tax=Velamenicoccus archaeovorus TaxID=1930593 RepID=UPI000FFEC3EE|nr:tRNA (adenosine(37)-N6)-threonylcarbamoyltransferase complex transferase subunit TsaD [Candidatus Velamenicoccus archaeovorus]